MSHSAETHVSEWPLSSDERLLVTAVIGDYDAEIPQKGGSPIERPSHSEEQSFLSALQEGIRKRREAQEAARRTAAAWVVNTVDNFLEDRPDRER